MLQKRSLIAAVKFISSLDPAIDRDAPAFSWEEYRKTGEDKFLPLKEGAKPTVFELAPLTRKQLGRVLSFDRPIDQVAEAVAYGLKSVTDFMIDGEPLVIEHQTTDGERRVKSHILDKLYDPSLFGELGSRILELNRLGPTSG